MAGKRDNIAWWRRVKHVALVLCVQCAVLWVVMCAIAASVEVGRDGVLLVFGGMVTYEHAPMPPLTSGVLVSSLNLGDVVSQRWSRPAILPSWQWTPASPPASPGSFMIGVPVWPVPVAFAGLAWYAGKRIKQLRRDACAKCGYDTRGLAAGAVCPECGTACGGPR